MKYLVTGGAGFIGFSLSKKLLELGEEIVIIDNLSDYYDVNLKKSRLDRLDSAEIVVGDISDVNFLKEVLESYQIEKIIHLAAQAGVRYSIENPFEYEKSNNLATLNIFQSAKEFEINHIIYASSSSVYGGNNKHPFSISDKVDTPVSLYAATKKYSELMAHVYFHLHGIKSTGLRFFTVYGPWGRPDMSIFKFTKSIINGEKIDIYNNGDHVRDFTYIDDIVSGIIKALEANTGYSIYNLGNNKPIELMKLISLIEENLGIEAQKNYLPMQMGDVHTTYADIDITKEELGWEPKVNIDEGLKLFIDWYKDYYL